MHVWGCPTQSVVYYRHAHKNVHPYACAHDLNLDDAPDRSVYVPGAGGWSSAQMPSTRSASSGLSASPFGSKSLLQERVRFGLVR